MKNLSFILIALISFSCFSLLEKSLDKMENDMEKVINNCKPFCSDYKVEKKVSSQVTLIPPKSNRILQLC